MALYRLGFINLKTMAVLLFVVFVSACTQPVGGFRSSSFDVNEFKPVDSDGDGEIDVEPFPFAVYDPLEPFNRGVYNFNTVFDRYVFLPVIDAYRFVVPQFARNRIHDFFKNLTELRNAANGILQGRPEVASRAIIRFLVNSTVGLLGTFDVATKAGVSQHSEDFGQTLGWWGLGDGPFLVLPILGPSNVRDTTGLVGDTIMANTVFPIEQITETVYFNPAVYLLFAIDLRNSIDFSYYESGSPFEYDFVRFLYTKKRQLDIER